MISSKFLLNLNILIQSVFQQNSFLVKFSTQTNLHGFNHIANKSYTIIERFGWLVLSLLSTYFAFFISINQVAQFINSPFIISVEADYHSWAYDRASLTFCGDYLNESFIDENYKRFENITSIDYNSKVYRDYYHYMKIIGSLNADNINLINDFENTQLFKNLTGEELLDIALNQKSWPDEQKMPDYLYRPVVTEAGICRSTTKLFKYLKASQNDSDDETSPYLSKETCDSVVKCRNELVHKNLSNINPYNRGKIYFHGLNDTLNMKRSAQSEWYPVSGYYSFLIDIIEVITSDRAKIFGIETRKCRFDTETTSNRSYPLGLYTQNLCLMECSVDAAIKICKCQPYFYKLGPGPVCNVTGMICLSKNRWNEYRNNCSCLPQCNAIDYSVASMFVFYRANRMAINVEQSVKKTRLRRDLKYELFYLVVSVGGAAALFLGCSFISIAELIYFAVKHVRQVYFGNWN